LCWALWGIRALRSKGAPPSKKHGTF
jgi:hypothetical protein